MRRRSLLASAALTALSLSSGCLESVPGESRPSPKLGWVAVSNYSPEPVRFRIQIERDGTIVHDSTHEVQGKPEDIIPGDVLECTWGDARGPYTLRGRVNGGEWVERAVEEAIDDDPMIEGTPDCVIAEGVYSVGASDIFAFEIRDTCEAVPGFDGGCEFANSES